MIFERAAQVGTLHVRRLCSKYPSLLNKNHCPCVGCQPRVVLVLPVEILQGTFQCTKYPVPVADIPGPCSISYGPPVARWPVLRMALRVKTRLEWSITTVAGGNRGVATLLVKEGRTVFVECNSTCTYIHVCTCTFMCTRSTEQK